LQRIASRHYLPRIVSSVDLALTPVTDAEMDTLELFHHTEAAETFTARERRPAAGATA